MAEIVVLQEGDETLGLLQNALNAQGDLGKRIVDAKALTSAPLIERAMDEVCADVLKYIDQWVKIGKRAVFGEGCVLSWTLEYWRELTPLHAQYDNFDELARAETGEEYSTYRAKIAIYRVFIENRHHVPKIEEIGAASFLDVPIGKLQKATAKAKKDDLTDEQWEALLDPQVNDAQFRAILGMSGTEGNSGPEETSKRVTVSSEGELTFWRNHEGVLAHEGVANVKIGVLYVNVEDEDAREMIDALIERAGVSRV